MNPYEIFSVLLIFVVLPAAVFGTVIWRFVRRALDLKHLAELGTEGRVETEAIVLDTEERIDKIRGSGTRRHLVRYEYRDGFGKIRRARAEVPEPAFRGLVVGGPLLVAYSPRRPCVSAPTAAIEEAAARFAARRRISEPGGSPEP